MCRASFQSYEGCIKLKNQKNFLNYEFAYLLQLISTVLQIIGNFVTLIVISE